MTILDKEKIILKKLEVWLIERERETYMRIDLLSLTVKNIYNPVKS